MHMGINIGVNRSSGVTSDLLLLGNPLVWWDFSDADSLTFSTSNNLDNAANKGTGGADYDLFHNSGVRITVTAGEAVCNGSQNDYRSGVAGDYDFMHNGAGCHVFYVISHDSADSGANILHITNDVAGSSSNPGSRFYATQSAGNHRYQSLTGYGGGVLNHLTAVDSIPEDVYTIAEFTVKTESNANDIVIRDDGVLMGSFTDGGLLSATSHAAAARFFVSNTSKVKAVLIYDRRLPDAERHAVYRKLAQLYSLPAMNVTMLIGDSNAGGQGASASLSANYDGIINRSYIWAFEDGSTSNDLAFWPHEQSHGYIDASSSNAGADLSLMYTIAQATGEKEYLIKAFEGGSDLFAKWHPSDYPDLNTSWDEFVLRVDQVKAWAAQMGRTINWRALVQILGHNDCSATFRADAYENNLTDLNAAIRAITRADLDIIISKTSLEGLDSPDAGFTTAAYQATVRTAQDTVATAETNTVTYQPIAGALAWSETTPDGIHYNMASLEDMGEEIGAVITA